MPIFCTYFDHNYLPKGLITLASLRRQCPNALVHVLCLSSQCRQVLDDLRLQGVELHDLAELEAADTDLFTAKANRSVVEYYWTLTPCLPRWLYRLHPDYASITYIDADLFFLSDPLVLFAEGREASVLVTPHNFPERMRHKAESYGKYNVSWLTFANTQQGRACLEWYRERCLEWCFYRQEDGKMGDQKYLDYFAEHFSGVHALTHSGAGVAPWNIETFRFSLAPDGSVHVDDKPIVFYHAHAFWQAWWRLYDPGIAPYCPIPHALRKSVLEPYAAAFHSAARKYGDAKGLLRRSREPLSMKKMHAISRHLLNNDFVWAGCKAGGALHP